MVIILQLNFIAQQVRVCYIFLQIFCCCDKIHFKQKNKIGKTKKEEKKNERPKYPFFSFFFIELTCNCS